VDKSGGDAACWNWTAVADASGRGKFLLDRRTERAPRVAYMLDRGEIPAGMLVCHRCDNPGCVNPSHLFLGTQKDNMGDAKSKGRAVPPPVMRGEDHPESKLTEEQVRGILSYLGAGFSKKAVARHFKVSPLLVRQIASGKAWRHVSGGKP